MQKYISIQNILIFVVFIFVINSFWQSNRKNYYRHQMRNNFHQRDSFAAVARLQHFELESLEKYIDKTDYYRNLSDSLWNEMLSLESTFEVQHKIIKRNRKTFDAVYDRYREEKNKPNDTITIIKKEIIYKENRSDIVVVKEKKGFFKRLFGKKND